MLSFLIQPNNMDSDGRDQHPTDADSTTHYAPENPDTAYGPEVGPYRLVAPIGERNDGRRL